VRVLSKSPVKEFGAMLQHAVTILAAVSLSDTALKKSDKRDNLILPGAADTVSQSLFPVFNRNIEMVG